MRHCASFLIISDRAVAHNPRILDFTYGPFDILRFLKWILRFTWLDPTFLCIMWPHRLIQRRRESDTVWFTPPPSWRDSCIVAWMWLDNSRPVSIIYRSFGSEFWKPLSPKINLSPQIHTFRLLLIPAPHLPPSLRQLWRCLLKIIKVLVTFFWCVYLSPQGPAGPPGTIGPLGEMGPLVSLNETAGVRTLAFSLALKAEGW